MPQPLLLLAAPSVAEAAAGAIRTSLDIEIVVAADRRAGLVALRRQAFTMVLVDEALAHNGDVGGDLLYVAAGDAPVLEINFAICGSQRVARQVRATLTRRGHDLEQARRVAARELQCELGGSLAGLLLHSELLLRDATPAAAPRLRNLVALAGDLRDRLRIAP